jgi:hypothetical protein
MPRSSFSRRRTVSALPFSHARNSSLTRAARFLSGGGASPPTPGISSSSLNPGGKNSTSIPTVLPLATSGNTENVPSPSPDGSSAMSKPSPPYSKRTTPIPSRSVAREMSSAYSFARRGGTALRYAG